MVNGDWGTMNVSGATFPRTNPAVMLPSQFCMRNAQNRPQRSIRNASLARRFKSSGVMPPGGDAGRT